MHMYSLSMEDIEHNSTMLMRQVLDYIIDHNISIEELKKKKNALEEVSK